jgi:uncharacterized protein YjiK
MMRPLVVSLFAVCCAVSACERGTTGKNDPPKQPDPAELARRATQFDKAVAAPDSGANEGGAVARWILPDKLKEISGLALTADGRLLGHGDQKGHVFEIDYRRGVLVKEFTLAKDKEAVKGDFEAIAIANDRLFLLESDGKLYEFREGADGANVDFSIQDTGLKPRCEFEGLAFDKTINSLLLACKKVHDKSLKDSLVIYRWKLAGDNATRLSRLTVPLKLAIGSNEWDGLHPSDITVDPFHGNYVLIASRENALIEITPAGAVVLSRPLPGTHEQAEGVAITRDSLLIISDEAGNPKTDPAKHPNRAPDDPGHRPAVVTVYRWP